MHHAETKPGDSDLNLMLNIAPIPSAPVATSKTSVPESNWFDYLNRNAVGRTVKYCRQPSTAQSQAAVVTVIAPLQHTEVE